MQKQGLGSCCWNLWWEGKKAPATKGATAYMGPNFQSGLEKAELKDMDFFLERKLKFGQETETNPPMPVKFTQRGSRLFWVLFCGC